MKKVKLNDVAKYAGVSPATVSRVLNNSGYVAQGKRDLVEKAVRELGYLVKEADSEDKKTKTIGLVLYHIPTVNMFFDTLHAALLQAAEEKGYHTLVQFYTDLNNETLAQGALKLSQHNVCGLIVCGFQSNYISDETRITLFHCNIPVVFVERVGHCYGFNRVMVDNRLGGYLGTKLLLEHGHKKLLYITRPKGTHQVETARLGGFLHAIESHESQVEYLIKETEDFTVENGRHVAEEAFQEVPDITGIVAWSDVFAAGAMQYLYQAGKRVPEDVELVGYDNTYAPLLSPPISSVQMPYSEIAETAVEMITENMGKATDFTAKTVTLEPKLVVRV